MRRFALIAGFSALAVLGACSERTTSPSAAPAVPRQTVTAQTVCLTETQIYTLLDAAFLNGSPDEQSAFGKWDNIQKQKAAGDRDATLKAKVEDLVRFILEKQQQGKLVIPSTNEGSDFWKLINALLCYGNSPLYYPGGNALLINPGDPAIVLRNSTNEAVMSLPADAVNEPTLIAITESNATLNTDLDKYPKVFEFNKYPATPFKRLIVAEACAYNVPDDVPLSVLVLGHNKSDGSFELLPKPAVDPATGTGSYTSLVTCTTAPTVGVAPASVGDRLLALVLPNKLYAASMLLAGGGVAGSVLELSPIGPVDPRVNVTKVEGATSAPIGSLVSPSPRVRLETPYYKTRMKNVVVGVSESSGPGYLTGSTFTASGARTDNNGEVSVTWRLGNTPGQYGIRVAPTTADNSGAVDGVLFSQTPVTFDATAVPPTKLVVTQGPATNSSIVAGALFTPPTIVQAQDDLGRVVEGYTGTITMGAVTSPGGVAQAFVNPLVNATANAVAGVATFGNLAITRTGTYTVSPSGSYANAALPVTGAYNVTITPAAPIVEKIAGDAQTADAGSTLGTTSGTIAPRVRVRDTYGNLWTGRQVYWQTFDGSIVPTTPSFTGTNGEASTTWTIGGGVNELFATLTPNSFLGTEYVVFTANGTRDRTAQSCGLGTNREDAPTTFLRWVNNRLPSQINSLELYLSITGNAAKDRVPVRVRLVAYEATETATRGVFNAPVEKASVERDAALKGNASEDAPVSFAFTNGYVPTAGTRLTFRVFRVAGGDNGTLRFNTGNCTGSPLQTFNLATGALVRSSVAFQLR